MAVSVFEPIKVSTGPASLRMTGPMTVARACARRRDKTGLPGSVARLWALLLAVLLPCAAAGSNIYKYQDENGIWHYTDREPGAEHEVETVYMEREPEPRVKLRREGTEANPVYVLFNDFWGPVEVEISLSDTVNVISEPPLPARWVIPGQDERTLVGLGALDLARGAFSYRLHLVTVPGPPIAQSIEGLVVHPPFGDETGFFVSQGFQGDASHLTPDSGYAVDIEMPVGTPVLAAREGVVMDVEEDFSRAGLDPLKFADKANHVRLLHDDGSMALYAHLDLASVQVQPGARVRTGQVLARSGNTGFSTGPHLHFALQQNVGLQIVSLPFRFHQPGAEPVIPQQGGVLRGTLPAR